MPRGIDGTEEGGGGGGGTAGGAAIAVRSDPVACLFARQLVWRAKSDIDVYAAGGIAPATLWNGAATLEVSVDNGTTWAAASGELAVVLDDTLNAGTDWRVGAVFVAVCDPLTKGAALMAPVTHARLKLGVKANQDAGNLTFSGVALFDQPWRQTVYP